ncbi:MAG: hypothetical protein RIC16_08975 [Rhodospirillales bacterium]
MIDVFPFAGFTVAVLGLGPEGRKTARALSLSEVEVWAWDDDPDNRAAAEADDVPLTNLGEIDWREPVSLIIEAQIPHGQSEAHPLVTAARAAGCEVISDLELVSRSQRDASYIAVVSRKLGDETLAMLKQVFLVAGRDVEAGGNAANPILNCHPLEAGGTYIALVPPGRADITVTVTFDQVLFLDFGSEPWPPFTDNDASLEAIRWVFHRQTAPRGAVINIDDPAGRALFEALAEGAEQVLIPMSLANPVVGGVYVVGGWLIDDRKGDAVRVVQLPVAGDPAKMRMAVGAYALCVLAGVPEHAAMASMMGYFND